MHSLMSRLNVWTLESEYLGSNLDFASYWICILGQLPNLFDLII